MNERSTEDGANSHQWTDDGGENLATAGYKYGLEDRGFVAFNLDHEVSGVGGTPIEPFDEFQVQPVETSFAFRLHPFILGEDDPMALAPGSTTLNKSSNRPATDWSFG